MSPTMMSGPIAATGATNTREATITGNDVQARGTNLRRLSFVVTCSVVQFIGKAFGRARIPSITALLTSFPLWERELSVNRLW